MKDAYKVNVINQHIEAAKADEYYSAQLTGKAGKPINLDEGALNLLKEYYGGREPFPMRSAEDVIAARDENNYVEGFISIHISTMIDNDLEGFLDIISEELVGSNLLMDINYDVVGLEDDNMIILKVRGDASEICSDDEENEVQA